MGEPSSLREGMGMGLGCEGMGLGCEAFGLCFSLHKVTKITNALQISGQKKQKKVMKAIFVAGATH